MWSYADVSASVAAFITVIGIGMSVAAASASCASRRSACGTARRAAAAGTAGSIAQVGNVYGVVRYSSAVDCSIYITLSGYVSHNDIYLLRFVFQDIGTCFPL